MRIDKDNIKIILILLVVALGIGYSYLNTELNINGTANVNSANWNVYWNNVQVSNGSVEAEIPILDANQTTVGFNVNLEKPGDYYEFTVDAVNAGTLDAMIESISSKLNGTTITTLPAYLDYNVTYSDGMPLQPNQELLHDSTETYKVRIAYKDDISASDLPETNQSLSLQFSVTYKQAGENSQEVEHAVTKYTVNVFDFGVVGKNQINIGQKIPDSITQYNSASDAMAAFENKPFYLKHTVQGGKVKASYVEFVITPAMASSNSGMNAGTYALRGFNTYDENASSTNNCNAKYYIGGYCINPYYESNKETLLQAFGSVNCGSESDDENSKFLYCSASGFEAKANSNGNVNAGGDGWNCGVYDRGDSVCSAVEA